ncbi:MAG: urea carboxylase-associated family protein [Gammaproteobacteria bacterium]|nr:urea carboxylase-associated family protein [Gammaproteobacteria bacterium]MDH3464837.1 urea carboxylase-associated family protein [Gammaproteobacteria bacterium]
MTIRSDIPATQAVSIALSKDQHCRIINTEGGQVVDTWAFNANCWPEYLSMEHSRSAIYRLLFRPGDVLVSNQFNLMMTIIEDTSPGQHDTLHAACSYGSNRYFGSAALSPNCQDNLKEQIARRGHTLTHVPCPWNLFEHATVDSALALHDETSAAKAGDYIELRAEMDLILVCSACPSTVGKISGDTPKGAAIDVIN